jgi:hypothetical protein
MSIHAPRHSRKLILKSLFRIDPLALYNEYRWWANKEGILTIPILEMDVSIYKGNAKKIAHIAVINEDEQAVFGNSGLYEAGQVEDMLERVPANSILVLNHPFHPIEGLATFMPIEKVLKLVEKYEMLVEFNGWIYSFDTFTRALGRLPLVPQTRFYRRGLRNVELMLKLSDFEPYVQLFGLDIHAPHLLPGGTGFVEYEGELIVEDVLQKIRAGDGRPVLPMKVSFQTAVLWLGWEYVYSFYYEWLISKLMGTHFDSALQFPEVP